jgi:hypothetical protein
LYPIISCDKFTPGYNTLHTAQLKIHERKIWSV